MMTIGLIGGMSWHSTIEYYRTINELVAQRRGGHASAPIALQSLDFAEVRECQLDEDWDRAAQLLATAAQRTERSGADVVLLCTNLMHKVADQVQAAIDVPLLHIADAIATRAQRNGWTELGVLGTRWVMEQDFYVGRLTEAGVRVHVPAAEQRAEVDRVIFDELTLGQVVPSSRDTYCQIIDQLAQSGAQAVVLACTEIEMLVQPEDSSLPLLDSMRTHAEAAVDFALDEVADAALPHNR